MTHPDAGRVEAAAKALSRQCCDGCENEGHIEPCMPEYCGCRRMAMAAIAAADAYDAANGVVRAPVEPPSGLLVSMAICLNHGFGAPGYLTDIQKNSMLSDMRKLYDEVVGHGYWKPERAGQYVAWGPADTSSSPPDDGGDAHEPIEDDEVEF